MRTGVNCEFAILTFIMLIDGKALADSILTDLGVQVTALTAGGVVPTLAVILVGDNPASLAYIRQKQKAAEKIGARLIFDHQTANVTGGGLYNLIAKYNSDPTVHGLIIQRPIPKEVGRVDDVLLKVQKAKDVDGFLPDSPFEVPVALAVGEILKSIHTDTKEPNDYADWLRKKKVVVIGRGETAGKPIAAYLSSGHFAVTVVHSQTPDPEKIVNNGDIIISCVGKERVVAGTSIKPGCILISVGIWRDSAGKLRGDYDEPDISSIAGWYTPTPGGVGPVNVACLMKNVIKACTIQKGGKL